MATNGQVSLSESQIQALLTHLESLCPIKENGLRNYLIVSFMLHGGLRVGECVQLVWEHVYLDGKPLESIMVDWSIAKNSISRSVPMCRILRDALISYHSLTVNPTGFVFPAPKNPNAHLSIRNVQEFLARASQKSIGIRVNPHMLRHTFATRLMRVSDMRTVQTLLGHKSIKSTQAYTHPSQEDLLQATNYLDELNQFF